MYEMEDSMGCYLFRCMVGGVTRNQRGGVNDTTILECTMHLCKCNNVFVLTTLLSMSLNASTLVRLLMAVISNEPSLVF